MSDFVLSSMVGDVVSNEVVRWGAQKVETGGFLLRPRRGVDAPDFVALSGDLGVLRRIDQFIISGCCMDLLSEWADDNAYRVQAQFHSHMGGAFLSPIDRIGGLRFEGFISIVVPNFAAPDSSPSSWGWWEFFEGDWRSRAVPKVSDAEVKLLVFDENGVNVG